LRPFHLQIPPSARAGRLLDIFFCIPPSRGLATPVSPFFPSLPLVGGWLFAWTGNRRLSHSSMAFASFFRFLFPVHRPFLVCPFLSPSFPVLNDKTQAVLLRWLLCFDRQTYFQRPDQSAAERFFFSRTPLCCSLPTSLRFEYSRQFSRHELEIAFPSVPSVLPPPSCFLVLRPLMNFRTCYFSLTAFRECSVG